MHRLRNMRLDMPRKMYHDRPARRTLVPRILLRTMLLLPLLRNARHDGYDEPVSKTYQPDTNGRQSSHPHGTIPAGPSGHYEELFRKTIFHQTAGHPLCAKSHRGSSIARINEVRCQEGKTAEEAHKTRVENPERIEEGRLCYLPDSQRNSRY